MDARRFDRLVRALGAARPRRALLGLLVSLPHLGGLAAFLAEENAHARGRRKRRKKRHKHGRPRPHGKRKNKNKKCQPKSRARICAGKCGVVKDNCKKTVDCGSSCPECRVCDDVTGTCEPDPATVGDPCGEPDQVCQSDGTCACDDSGCGGVCGCEAGFVCDAGACQPCDVLFDGDSISSGQTLQERMTMGGAIRVCPGRYQHNFALSANVVVTGAGDGEDEATSTILDAGGSGRTLQVNGGVNATLQGVRITGGNESLGGGIRNDGMLMLIACTVSGNVANLGGGLYNSFDGPSRLTLNDCRVTENSANRGGGIDNNSVFTVTLDGCTVSGNDSASDGGGIFNNGGVFDISGSEISGNEAQENGGGVYNNTPVVGNDGDVTFDDTSRVTNNTAGAGGAGTGGGVFNGGTVTLGGATVTDNEPNNCAGGPIVGCVEDP